MINPEVRHIIEAELTEGEELLWAEKTKAYAQQKIVQTYEDDTETFTFLAKGFLWFGVPLLIIFIIFLPPIRLLCVIVLFVVPFIFATSGIASADELDMVDNMNIGAYALTNLRLFEFDKSLKITRRDDASKLRKVWEQPTCINMSPIGSGVIKFRSLFFLNNNYATTNYIRKLIESTSASEVS